MKRMAISILCAILVIIFASCSSETPEIQSLDGQLTDVYIATALSEFRGQWESEILPFDDVWTLNIDEGEEVVLLSSAQIGIEFFSVDWEIEDSQLILSMNDEANRAVITMTILENGEVMSGSYTQYGETSGISFLRLSYTPEIGELLLPFEPWEHVPFEERIQALNDFSLFEDDGIVISFTYDLNRRDLYMDLIEEFDLDTVTAGYSDVELMIVLLDWVKDHFRHNGASGMPVERDAMSIIGYMRENPSGINCRGLAILLAEVLRLYGVEAKHITVYPYEDNHPVHVVTHAYSRELNQWIMLDPTFRIYVTDENGHFMNLYTLRRDFAGGAPLFANENATHNDRSFTMEEYKLFMADYLFRFSTGTHFTFGSEESGEGTTQIMLVPVGFSGTGAEVTTTSQEAFFATP